MKLRNLIVLTSGMALLVAFAVARAEDKEAVTKVKCPVAGKEIKIADAKAAKYKDGKVYVCCGNCKSKLESDPAKFAEKANHQLFLTAQVKQVKCPMTGRPVNPKMVVKVGDAEVGLCCGGCKAKASGAKADEQLALLFSDKAFEKGFEAVKKKN